MTEEVTGIDIVQAQIKIAAGMTLAEMGLTQDKVRGGGAGLCVSKQRAAAASVF